MPVKNSTNERLFLSLKIIKNILRKTMGQKNIDTLGILSIKNYITAALVLTILLTSFQNRK